MLYRRHSIALASLAFGSIGRARPAAASDAIRIGVLRFGTLSWELETIARHAMASGVRLEVVPLASNEAGKIALQAGSADMIVSDWLWVARQRSDGQPLVFSPFSKTIASLMVEANSPIKTLAELRGRRIGVAGGPLDKAWLLLVAWARRSGYDLPVETQPVYGASPLLAEQLARGHLDAALLFWNFAAQLEADGCREVIAIEQVERELGATDPVAMLGYVFDERWAGEHQTAVNAFLHASAKAKMLLRESDAEWDALRPLMQARSDAVFFRLRNRFRAGIPRRSVEEDEADAARLYEIIAQVGGPRLVGRAATMPRGTFYRFSASQE